MKFCITCLRTAQSGTVIEAFYSSHSGSEFIDYPTFLVNVGGNAYSRYVVDGEQLRLVVSVHAVGSDYCLDHYPAA